VTWPTRPAPANRATEEDNTKVRTRLVLAFAYVLITVIVALTVPLAVNQRERAESDLLGQAKVTAQAIAASFDEASLAPASRDRLARQAERDAQEIDGRVLVMDETGEVLADANPFPEPSSSAVGEDYATPQRPEVLTALADGEPDALVRSSEELDVDLLLASAPIVDDPRGRPVIVGAVRITLDVQRVTDSVRRATLGIVVIGLAGLAAGMLVALVLAGSLARPLARLAAAARSLGRGDLSTRVGELRGPDEVRDVAGSFDEMADRVERTFRAQRSFVANASHQLRTPLTGMKLRIERAVDDASDPALKAQLEAADQDVDRMAATVDRMLEMAHQVEEGAPTEADAGEAARAGVARWAERAAERGAAVTADVDGAAPVQANPTDLDQIVDNLLDNATAYAPGPIEVSVAAEPRHAVLAVRDHGPGIAPEEREMVTERFARGRSAPTGGSGLGLAIARDLAERWGGSLRVLGPPDGGTLVEVRLRSAQVGDAGAGGNGAA
jgi:signal transduction histidine kinase